MKRLHFLITILTVGAMSLITKPVHSQIIQSYSISRVSGSIYHFVVNVDSANPCGRGLNVTWSFAWTPGRPYTHSTGFFTMAPTGGTTYESDQNPYYWEPATPPLWNFVPSATSATSASYFCCTCGTDPQKR